VWLAEVWVRGTVEPVKISERAIERNISRLMRPRPTRPTLRGGGGDPDDDAEDDEDGSTIRTRHSGSAHSRASGHSGRTTPSAATLPMRSPNGGSRQSESASARETHMMREAGQGLVWATTPSAASIIPHPLSSQDQRMLVSPIDSWHMMTWDGTLRHRFPSPPLADDPRLRARTPFAKLLALYAHLLHLKKMVIPDMDMAALRARKQGSIAPTYYKATLDPYGPTQEEDITEFIERLIGAAKSKWKDVIGREDPRNPNSVQSAVQYLQDMILAHLVVFRHAKTPTTRTEVQAAIDTAFIPARDHGGTYALFKRILELLKQLPSPTGVPPYDTVLEAVLGGL
jgi:hypothetical protein